MKQQAGHLHRFQVLMQAEFIYMQAKFQAGTITIPTITIIRGCKMAIGFTNAQKKIGTDVSDDSDCKRCFTRRFSLFGKRNKATGNNTDICWAVRK